MNRYFRCAVIIWAVVALFPHSAKGAEDLTLVATSNYFDVYAPSDEYVGDLVSRLNVNYFLKAETLTASLSGDPGDVLSLSLDAVFLEVSEILGLDVYDFHGEIRIFPDQQQMGMVFQQMFSRDFKEPSFYLHDNQTIYISFSDLTLGMLGHEMAHAVISNYFVAPPPAKIQEVLSGYVEFKLQKLTASPGIQF